MSRSADYRRLDEQGHTYLDYTGGSLYAEAQVRAHLDLLASGIFGNPHSGNPASQAATALVEQTRAAVLEFFNASPDEYVAIFTPNASGALRLVGESYPFATGGSYLLSVDNHNSVNGIREYARRRGADVVYAPLVASDLRQNAPALLQLLETPPPGPKLFAFAAQSNLSGVQHSLGWIEHAQRHGWHVLLDASAYVPTNQLDLSRVHPDFVALSFYKMFGYPTGVGALLARREPLQQLERPWFAGGTITFSSVLGDGHYRTPGVAGFEDGTVDYLSIPAVGIGLRWLRSIGVDEIHGRVMALTETLLADLEALEHVDGSPVVRIYGPRDTLSRGANVAFNFVDPAGQLWDCWQVEHEANAHTISLRAGCHCNPGAREVALGLGQSELSACFANAPQQSYAEFLDTIEPYVDGVVRVSLGVASTADDIARFVEFARGFANRSVEVRAAVDVHDLAVYV